MEPLKPKALVKGDTIGIFSPSYEPQIGRLNRGVKALLKAGFKVELDPDIKIIRSFQRADDKKHAESFMRMWANPEIKAIFCSTGGYGAIRLLQYLDAEVFRANPKIFIGYSDITALHLWLNKMVGLVTFHGPTVDDLTPALYDPSLRSLLTAVTTPQPTTKLGRDISRPVSPGKAIGQLIGGNLSMVQQTIGTPYEVNTDGAILFLEEAYEPMSVVDERLIHLHTAGLLRNLNGIVLGQFSLDLSEEKEFGNFLLDLLSDLNIPIIMDFPAGHLAPNLTIPIGTQVELASDEESGWIRYKEPALI